MKILEVSIDRFGVLSSCQEKFSSSFNCILQDNGTGKTTLANFILAMLFGMEGLRKTDKNLKDRGRYAPWEGGKYGGVLEIEKDGTVYRIERTFDPSSPSGDLLTVYNKNEGMKKEEWQEEPGVRLLGMSKGAFLRTAYLSGKGKEEESAEDLLPRLNKSINGTEQSYAYERAMEILDKERKFLRADKGKKGRLEELDKEIDKALRERSLCEISARNAEETEKFLSKKKDELQKIEKTLSLYAAYQKALLIKQTYKDLFQKAQNATKALEEFYMINQKERADSTTMQQCKEALKVLHFSRAALEKNPLDPDEERELSSLEALFEKHSPTLEEIDGISRRLSDIEKEKRTITECRNAEEQVLDRFKKLEERFHGSVPTEKETEELSFLCADYETARREREIRLEKLTESMANRKPFPGILTILLGIFGILSLFCGILLPIFNLPFTLPLAIGGIACFAASVCLFIFKDRNRSPHPHQNAEDPTEIKLRELRTALAEKLALFQYDTENLPTAFATLCEDRKEYLSDKEFLTTNKKRKDACEERLSENLSKIQAFFDLYPLLKQEENDQKLTSLKNASLRYTALQTILKRNTEEKSAAKEQADNATALLEKLLSPFGHKIKEGEEEEAVEDEKQLQSEEIRLKDTEKIRQEAAEEYLKNNPLPDNLPDFLPDEKTYEEASAKKAVLEATIAHSEQKLREESRSAEHLEEWESSVEQLKKEKAESTKKYAVLCRTKELLERAELRLINRYTEPIRKAYIRYAEKIDPDLFKGLHVIPEDLSLRFEREGELRKSENFSSGFRALSEICLRLSILENVYTNALPFLILDDPFVYLDDRNAAKALEALKDLSSKTQILYLTCHSSRSLNNRT